MKLPGIPPSCVRPTTQEKTMRFMIIVKSCPEFEAEVQPDPDPAVMAAMAAYHEELARAGVLLDASGLKPSRTGWRIHYGPGGAEGTSSRCVVDGPFAEAKELIAGYTMIEVRSPGEALEKLKAIDAMNKP